MSSESMSYALENNTLVHKNTRFISSVEDHISRVSTEQISVKYDAQHEQ